MSQNPIPSQLDQQQILQRVFDGDNDKLRVDSSISVTSITGEVAVELSATDGDNVAISDGTDTLAVNADGSINVVILTGTPITALQLIGNSSLASIDNDIDVALSTRASELTLSTLNSKIPSNLTVASTRLLVDGSGVVQPVSQSGIWNINNISGTVSLPTGASTSALQITGNTSLSSIDGKIPSSLTVTSTRLLVDGSGVTQPISAISLPLPTGAATSALQTQPGVDIGDVTINNTSGASAVNIQDGGNSITIDGSVSAVQSGTWTVQQGTPPWSVAGNVASAATDSGNPVKVGGIVNLNGSLFTNAQRADNQMNAAGSTYVDLTGRILSYSAFSSFTTAATATDIFTVTGSSTKTIKIRSVVISGTNTGNTNALVIMLKRSTANTSGTSTTLTNVSHDSNNAAGTATVRSYTVNPTTGTLVGNIQGEIIFLPTLASSNSGTGEDFTYGDDGSQPIVLRGTSEVFAINLNSVALLGTTVMNISINWTEE